MGKPVRALGDVLKRRNTNGDMRCFVPRLRGTASAGQSAQNRDALGAVSDASRALSRVGGIRGEGRGPQTGLRPAGD